MHGTPNLCDESIFLASTNVCSFCCGLYSFKLTVFPREKFRSKISFPGAAALYTFSRHGLFSFTQHHSSKLTTARTPTLLAKTRNRGVFVFQKQSLANLEDEIFLKGGSVVTPQNFDLVLLIKILPGN